MRRKSLGSKLVLSLVVLVVLAAAVEATARLVSRARGETWTIDLGPQLAMDNGMYQPHPFIGYVLRPDVTRRHEGRMTHTNALGFCGPEISEEKPPGVLRVACLGGSTTWGVGASTDANAWPHALGALLEAALPPGSPWTRVEVINAGASGYTLMESFVDLKMRVLPLKPDLVVVYHGINDALVVGRAGFRPDYSHARGPWRIPVPSRWDLLLGWSALYGRARGDMWRAPNLYDLVYVKDFEQQRNDPAQQRGYETYRTTLVELLALARLHGAEAVFCTFSFTNGSPPLKREDWMRSSGFGIVSRLNQLTRRVAQEHGAPLVDLAAALGGDPGLFVDAVHLNDRGNAAIAEAVARGVLGDGLLRRLDEPRGVKPLATR